MAFPYIDKIQFHLNQTLREAMTRFSETAIHTNGIGFGVVTGDDKRCVGVITDGDIRRRLVDGISIDASVKEVVNTSFVYATPESTSHQILKLFEARIRVLPVIDKDGRLADIYRINDFNASARMEKRIIRSKAPVRISFSGGGTDMSNFFNDSPGYVLSATINKYCYASVKVLPEKQIKIVSKDYNKVIEVDTIEQFDTGDSLDLIKTSVKLMNPQFGFQLETFSEIDPGTGLGGSSAISAAVIGAFNYFRKEDQLDKYNLADLAYQAERVELGVAGGWQDQYATVFGGLNLIEFRKNEIVVIPIRVQGDILLELQFNLLLFRFGSSRKSGDIVEDQKKQLQSNKGLNNHYQNLAENTLKMKDALLKGEIKCFGELLNNGWNLKKKFSNKISNNYIDHLYTIAIKAGALGGKVLGAGSSGYLLVCCRPTCQGAVIEALESKGAKLENFDFVKKGLQTWTTRY